jgi:hypothetical protein
MLVFDIAAKQGVRLADHTTKLDAAYIGDNHEVAEDNLSKTAYLNIDRAGLEELCKNCDLGKPCPKEVDLTVSSL